MKRLLAFSLALAFVFTFTLAGCGGSTSQSSQDSSQTATSQENTVTDTATNSEPVELRVGWWGSQNRADRTTKVIEMYMQKVPNVKITPEFTSWDEYWNKMSVQAAGGSLPDVMQQDEAYLAQYVGKNLLLDLNPFVESGALDLSDVNEKMLQVGVYDGKLFAVSLGLNALAFGCDPAMFQKAGIEVPDDTKWTWKDFEDITVKLHEKLGDGIYGSSATWTNMDYFVMYVKQHGQSFANADASAVGYDDKLFVDYMNMSLKLRKAGAVPTIEESAAVAGLEDYPMVHGTAAIEPAINSNEFVAVSEAANRPLALLLPPTGTTEGRVMKNSQFFSVTSGTKVAEEAAKFISYFTNDIEANKILLGERGVPFASKVRDALQSVVSEAQKATFVYVDRVEKLNAEVDPFYPPGDLYEIWKVVTDEVMYEKITPEDGAKKFREQTNEILAKYKG